MKNYTIGSRSDPHALKVGTYWPGANTCDGTVGVQRAESVLLFRRAGLITAILLCVGGATTFPAAGQGISTPSGGTTQNNPTQTNSSPGLGRTNQAPSSPVSGPVDAATAMGITPRPGGQFRIQGNNATADFAVHRLTLASNLRAEGSVELVMPDGLALSGQPVGLFYFNASGESIMIADVTDTTGQIIQSGSVSQVLYTNALGGASVKADILYSYTQLTVQQDVIFRTQIPSPESVGIYGDVSLGFFSSFNTTAVPNVIPDTIALSDYNLTNAALGNTLADQTIIFPTMNIVRGRGFLLGDTGIEIPIVKTWQAGPKATGSINAYYLIESVPLALIRDKLAKLPPATASVFPRSKVNLQTALQHLRQSPRARVSAPMRLAKAMPKEPGFVWDYTIVSQPVMNFLIGPRVPYVAKVGFAAAGETTNDVWNQCLVGTTTGLLWSTGVASSTGVTISDAPGNWGNPVTDPMYDGYVYTTSGNLTVVITNMPSGNYDFYIYSHGAADAQSGLFYLESNGSWYGPDSNSSTGSFSWNSSYWELGQQYLVYTNIPVASNQTITLEGFPDPAGYMLINGMQIVPTTSSCFNAPNGLVSWWQGEGNPNDAVGVNNATAHGGVTYATGKVGQAFSFDGSSGYLSVPSSASLNIGTNGTGLTIEGWIKPTTVGKFPLLEWNNGTNASVYLWLNSSANCLEFNLEDTNNYSHDFIGVTNMLTSNVWWHIAVTYDSPSGAINFFTNGTLALATNVNWNWVLVPQTSYNVFIGGRTNASYYYSGLMDELSLYNRALLSSEVASAYSAGNAGHFLCVSSPMIISQPLSQTVSAGNDATMQVSALGTSLYYQWFFNGVAISGATASALNLKNVPTGDAGNYAVAVTNASGSVTSNPAAVLTVNPPVLSWAPSGLVAWWRAEWDANDALGTNNGSLEGGVSFAPGKVGRAFSFDGSTGYVAIPASPSLNVGVNGTGFTLACWIKPAALGWIPLVLWDDGATGVPFSFWVDGDFDNLHLYVFDTNGTGYQMWSQANLVTTNDFQHVAVTYDKSSGNASLYYNGVVVETEHLGTFTAWSTNNVYLGAQTYPVNPAYYNGLMDEVAIYNRGLSAAEIAGIYNESTLGFAFAPTNWLSQYWGSGWATNVNAAANADDVGDGVPNYLKYIQGRNPTNTTVVDTNQVIQLNVYTPLVYPAPPPTAIQALAVTSFGPLRNNYSGTVGFHFTALANVTVTQLGRWTISGNSQTHAVTIYDNSYTPLGAVTVVTSGATSGQFTYVALGTPVHLTSGSSYFVDSYENSGGDQWYDLYTSVTPTADIGSVTQAPGGAVGGSANNIYVLVDFIYTKP